MASTISKAASGRGSLSIRLRRDSYPLLFIMTSVGGFCASYSFLARGGVFAFAQTGNIIYSGHVMASGHFLGVLTFLFPILSYMLGLFLSQQLRDRQADLVTFEKIILLFQSLLMTLSALMPDSFAATRLVLCLLGLSSGLQMQTFHRVEGHEYTSIMVMGNMKRTVEAFSAYLKDHETGSLKKTLLYIFINSIFCLGSAWGFAITKAMGDSAIIVPALFLLFGALTLKE